jgi:hypothetical protein
MCTCNIKRNFKTKKMKNVINIWVIVLMAFCFTTLSCTKEGPEGPIGPAGIDGIDGVDGQDGADGNANVFASDWIEPTEGSYGINNPDSKSLVLAELVSSDVINGGVILVYYDNDIEIHSLPYYNLSPIDGELQKSVTTKLNHATRNLYLNLKKYTGDFLPKEYLWDPNGPAYGKGVRFRYVLIPSSMTGKETPINFAKMDYYDVMDHFGINY